MTLSLPPLAGLAYCRHLSTVRTHLSALVNHMIVSPDLPCDAGHGLTAGIWEQYLQDSTVRLGLARLAVGQRLWGNCLIIRGIDPPAMGIHKCFDILGFYMYKWKAPFSP